MLLFGTGKFHELEDLTAEGLPTQTFYGIWDKYDGGTTAPTIEDADLLAQTIVAEETQEADIDGDGDLDSAYQTAQQIDANAAIGWENVIAVRVDMLMRGDSDALVDSDAGQNLVFNGTVENFTDGFLRQGMSSTVTVRNRVP